MCIKKLLWQTVLGCKQGALIRPFYSKPVCDIRRAYGFNSFCSSSIEVLIPLGFHVWFSWTRNSPFSLEACPSVLWVFPPCPIQLLTKPLGCVVQYLCPKSSILIFPQFVVCFYFPNFHISICAVASVWLWLRFSHMRIIFFSISTYHSVSFPLRISQMSSSIIIRMNKKTWSAFSIEKSLAHELVTFTSGIFAVLNFHADYILLPITLLWSANIDFLINNVL